MINDKEAKYLAAIQMMMDKNMSTREVARETGLKSCTILKFIHRENGLKSISAEVYKKAIRQLKRNKKEAMLHRKNRSERILQDRDELVNYLDELGFNGVIFDGRIDTIILHIGVDSIVLSLKVKNKVIVTFENKGTLIYNRRDFMNMMKFLSYI